MCVVARLGSPPERMEDQVRFSSDPPSCPLRPHRALLTLAPFPLLIIRVAILHHLLSSVFRYVTSCQSCSSGNCDQEGIPLRILPFRKARTELQEAHFGWQARGDWPRGPARAPLRHDRRHNVVQRACDRPQRPSHPLRMGFVMIALNEALRSIVPPAPLPFGFLLPRHRKRQEEGLTLQ